MAQQIPRQLLRGDRDVYIAKFFRFKPSPLIRSCLVRWTKPNRGESKLNTDASVRDGKAAGAGVIRDHNGQVFWGLY